MRKRGGREPPAAGGVLSTSGDRAQQQKRTNLPARNRVPARAWGFESLQGLLTAMPLWRNWQTHQLTRFRDSHGSLPQDVDQPGVVACLGRTRTLVQIQPS